MEGDRQQQREREREREREMQTGRQTDRPEAVELWNVFSQVQASGRTLVLTFHWSVSQSVSRSLRVEERRGQAGRGTERNRARDRERGDKEGV